MDDITWKPNGLVIEKARINKKESEEGIFPYDSYIIRIWSNDPEPPHFHIENEGWDIAITINDGELYKIDHRGQDLQAYNHILSNVKCWLQSRNAIIPSITNKQNALSVWEQLHP
jgi:hypothetical protein